ncbi:MAG: phenylalanine--tRNA ligase subunit alpha, partial [Bdellovibrionales bacterium]|nr:phenylalanine--tRNA ligase subunit alpha [Bdellovibrionales bacterium]
MPLSLASIEELHTRARARIEAAATSVALDEVRRELFGKKGELTELMKALKDAPAEERKSLGQALNTEKNALEELLQRRERALSDAELHQQLEAERIDVTLPVSAPVRSELAGSMHPLSTVQRELEKIFVSLGFSVVDGPEVETDYHNFEALNIPSTHPARDMQDTIFTSAHTLLRTHTSSIQVRSLERMEPPLRIVAPGRCFRYERLDASHEHTFYQMEGMMVDRNVTVGHLIYFMKTLLREIFGSDQKIRLRPGYFPFVEPGFELDIWFQ